MNIPKRVYEKHLTDFYSLFLKGVRVKQEKARYGKSDNKMKVYLPAKAFYIFPKDIESTKGAIRVISVYFPYP